jgi:hypothetical protein
VVDRSGWFRRVRIPQSIWFSLGFHKGWTSSVSSLRLFWYS